MGNATMRELTLASGALRCGGRSGFGDLADRKKEQSDEIKG